MGYILFKALCFLPLLYSSEELLREKAFHSIVYCPSFFSWPGNFFGFLFVFNKELFQRLHFQKPLDFSHFRYIVRREETVRTKKDYYFSHYQQEHPHLSPIREVIAYINKINQYIITTSLNAGAEWPNLVTHLCCVLVVWPLTCYLSK